MDRLTACEKIIMNPKISICIPTYNRKDYLREALDSIFSQTYKDYEIVIVDDGSTDGTAEKIKSCGYNVRYLWQENAGDAAARNKLIELAAGHYITFLDSDDLMMPYALERMTKAAEAEDEPVVVYGAYIRINGQGNVVGRDKRKLRTGYITRYLFEDILVHPGGSMWPTNVLRSEGGFDTSLPVCSDYDLWLRLSTKYRFIALDEPTFKRRRHSSNLSAASASNKMYELKVLRRFYYEKGGSSFVPQKVAMRRFSEEEYRVAKAFLKDGDFGSAAGHFRLCFQQHLNFKALLLWAFSALQQKLPGVDR
ncbi:MAG: glycosyltransferase [Sedimentisphaerales bacterium]|jgi:glycosyltransferase involved in cell wall biosynthesis